MWHLAEDTRRLLYAATIAIVFHGAVFVGIDRWEQNEAASSQSPETQSIRIDFTTVRKRPAPPVSPAAAQSVPVKRQETQPVSPPESQLVSPTDAPVSSDLPSPLHEESSPQDNQEAPVTAESAIGTTAASQPATPGAVGEEVPVPAADGNEKRAGPEIAAVTHPEPNYPEAARRAGVEGTVVVSLQIDRRGRPRDIELRESSGSTLLDREVLRTIRLWRFSRDHHGKTTVQRFVFLLEEGA